MKIGIIYIATGRYICFWKEFYETAKKFLFPNYQKEFFVITDNETFDYKENSDVKSYYYEKLPWPMAGLMKFDATLKAKEDILKCDYCYYFNANMKFIDYVGDEIIPKEENDHLAICIWPSFFNNTNNLEFPYDRTQGCWANVPMGEGEYYFMAGLHGGKCDKYIEMCEELNERTKEDVAKDLIASHHDESYLNRYFLYRKPLAINPRYAMPEKWKIKGCEGHKALILKKHHYKYGGHAYLRGETDKKVTRVKWLINKIFGTHLI